MRNLTRTHRALIILVVLSGVAHAGRAADDWLDPLEPGYERELDLALDSALLDETTLPGVDPCGCLRDLRRCLIAASLSLGGCLSRAPNPARQALCYIRFELNVLLCLDQAGTCQVTCVP